MRACLTCAERMRFASKLVSKTESAPIAAGASALPGGKEILAEQVQAVERSLPGMVAGTVLIPALLATALWHATSAATLLAWVGAHWLQAAINGYAYWISLRRPATPRNAGRRAQAAEVGALISGVLWAISVPLFWADTRGDLQVLLVFIVGFMTMSALHSLMPLLRAYLLFLLPCVVAVMITCAVAGGALNWVLVFTTLAYGLTSARFAAGMNRTLVRSFEQKQQLAQLAADLQRQKDLAEQASVSKSRFLAAASHDLRQPVHALSLFLGALATQPVSAEARRLVDHAEATVDSLSALFNALLDISRLDSGTVTPRIAPVALAALLDRVTHEERLLAEANGLTLRTAVSARARNAVVRSDAVLLERLLRNLVRNAVTYTERGGVLVALRARADRLLLQICDTGVGIAPDSIEEIFEEFVQLRNEERDRSQGLGLGLALVRRISALLGIEVTVRSSVGRGSVFSVSLPLATALQEPTGPLAPQARESQPLPAGALVLVIDDDAAVREGMRALLGSWGCRTVLAEGLDDLLPQLAAEPTVPALILCDFRLRSGANGLDVVARLRSEYNESLPAIVVTGDTAPERLREAQNANAIVTHKPLTPQRLREAMWRALRITP